jgi:hypothetical protein
MLQAGLQKASSADSLCSISPEKNVKLKTNGLQALHFTVAA